jgi:molybdopterin synthase sulfur carrier subunit
MSLTARARPTCSEAGQGPSIQRGIKLLYFAWLRARIGHAEENLPLPPEVIDVAGLLNWLSARSPRHAEALRDPSVIRVAVNQDYVGRDHPIRDGDEVAIFPPMTGG